MAIPNMFWVQPYVSHHWNVPGPLETGPLLSVPLLPAEPPHFLSARHPPTSHIVFIQPAYGVQFMEPPLRWVGAVQSPQGMPYGSLPRSLAEQALQKAQATPVLNLAPFSIQRSMSGKQDKGAHAAAERMQKASYDVLCQLTAANLWLPDPFLLSPTPHEQTCQHICGQTH